jgi:carboxylesterase type B
LCSPIVPSPLDGCDRDLFLIQHTLPKPELKIDELEGLNLNIAVPLTESGLPTLENNLPVFVYIHGGAFGMGSSAYPQYDVAKLVEFSAKVGTPAVGVAFK